MAPMMQFFERRKDPRIQHTGQALIARADTGFVVQLADVSKSAKFLGYKPTLSTEQGIPKFVEWFKTELVLSVETREQGRVA